jgi:quinol monooxygenase YgiN
MRGYVRRSFWVHVVIPGVAVLVLLGAIMPSPLASQASQPAAATPLVNPPLGGNLYITTFIDVLPQYTGTTLAMCKEYAAASRNDPGLVRFEVLAQAFNRENHIMLIVVWKTQKDYDNHVGRAHTKTFREKLLPYLGAPFDERVSHLAS